MSSPHQTLDAIAKEKSLQFNTAEFAQHMDSQDPLRSFRQDFFFPKQGPHAQATYLCGNSLGLQPKTTREYIMEELDEWANKGVEGHFNHSKNRDWLKTDEPLLPAMKEVVGAASESEVVIMNSLSANLHLLMVPFYRPTKQKFKIVIEAHAFPSDLYIVQSQARYHGFDPADAIIQLKPRTGEYLLRTEDIFETIKKNADEIALVLLPGIQYYTGQFFEIEKITAFSHSLQIPIGWDLAHAVGNVQLELHKWNVDFACWCTYKYLNSGPGNIGGAFVHDRHANSDLPRFAAWWGHDLNTRFQMDAPQFVGIPGAFGYRLSNPPVVCCAALRASLDLFAKAGMSNLTAKSRLMTCYLEKLIDLTFDDKEVKIISPRDIASRGCQLSLLFDTDATRIEKKLIEKGIVCDVRKPDVIRVAPAPLYNNFSDVFNFVNGLKEVLYFIRQEKGVEISNQDFKSYEQVNKSHTYRLVDNGSEEFDEVTQIKTVSMKDILKENPSESELNEFSQNLGSAFKDLGFAILTDTGISLDHYHEMDKKIKQFFKAPHEEKKKFSATRIGSVNQGYFGVKETSKLHPDLVEGWVFCRRAFNLPRGTGEKFADKSWESFWMNKDDELFFRKHVQMHEPLVLPIMQAILRFFKCDPHLYDQRLKNTNFGFRLNYYPGMKKQDIESGIGRMLGHEDVDLFTILPTPFVPGLQVYNHHNNKWIRLQAPPGSIIINTGDYMQRLTNDQLLSTTHRVAKPRPEEIKSTENSEFAVPERTSFPMAIYVWEDEMLEVLPTLQSESSYPPIQAETFHTRITSKYYGKDYAADKNKN